jgi:hypothetical protein
MQYESHSAFDLPQVLSFGGRWGLMFGPEQEGPNFVKPQNRPKNNHGDTEARRRETQRQSQRLHREEPEDTEDYIGRMKIDENLRKKRRNSRLVIRRRAGLRYANAAEPRWREGGYIPRRKLTGNKVRDDCGRDWRQQDAIAEMAARDEYPCYF